MIASYHVNMICNQQVAGSSPIASSKFETFAEGPFNISVSQPRNNLLILKYFHECCRIRVKQKALTKNSILLGLVKSKAI